MKEFTYTWDDEIFLLHVQLNNKTELAFQCRLVRAFQGHADREELVTIDERTTSHRFIVTRTHPKEVKFALYYPTSVSLQVFKVDDRAYYPTESFYSDI